MSKLLKSGTAGGRLQQSNKSNIRKMGAGGPQSGSFGRASRLPRHQQSGLGTPGAPAIYQFASVDIMYPSSGDDYPIYGVPVGAWDQDSQEAKDNARKFCELKGHGFAYDVSGSAIVHEDPCDWSTPPYDCSVNDHDHTHLYYWDMYDDNPDWEEWARYNYCGGSSDRSCWAWKTIQCTGTPYGGF
jgi:hypothetical protein